MVLQKRKCEGIHSEKKSLINWTIIGCFHGCSLLSLPLQYVLLQKWILNCWDESVSYCNQWKLCCAPEDVHLPASTILWLYKYDFILLCVSSSVNKQMRKNTKRARFKKNPHCAIGPFICIQNAWMNHVEIMTISLGHCNYGKTQHVQVRKMTFNFYFSVSNIIGRTQMNLAHSYLYVRKASVGFLISWISNAFKRSPSLSFNPIFFRVKLHIHFPLF